MTKFTNKRRNIKGTHHGKKAVTPYKYYRGRKEIIKIKENKYEVQEETSSY